MSVTVLYTNMNGKQSLMSFYTLPQKCCFLIKVNLFFSFFTADIEEQQTVWRHKFAWDDFLVCLKSQFLLGITKSGQPVSI